MIDQAAFIDALRAAHKGAMTGTPPDLHRLAGAISAAPIYAGGAQPTLTAGTMTLWLRPEMLADKAYPYALERSADEAFRAVVSFLGASSIRVRFSLLLRGIATRAPLDLGNGWAAHPPALRTDPQLAHIPDSTRPVSPEYCMILTSTKDLAPTRGRWDLSALPMSSEHEDEFLDAIRILSLTSTTGINREAAWTELADPRFEALIKIGAGVSFHHEEAPFMGPPPPGPASAFQQLLQSLSRLPEKSRNRLRSALDRLNSGFRRHTPGDKALDASIALETAVGTADGHGEITYRLRLRAALILGGSLGDRVNVWKATNKLYALRSAVVHRGGVTGRAAAGDEARAGLDVAAKVIRRLIEIGDVPDWSVVELSGGLPGSQ